MMSLKNYKNVAVSLLGFALVATCQSSWAGGHGIGNGGGSWVCREPSGSIRWSKLVDLFEATDEFGLTLKQYSGSTKEIVEQVKSHLTQANPNFFNEIAPYLRELNYLEHNPPFVTHTPHIVQTIDDSLYRIKPESASCTNGSIAYEQVVNYKNDGFILVETRLFDALDSNAQAALIFHEAIYKYRREVRLDKDSVATRRIVGLIFSTLSTEELKKQLEELGEKEFGVIGMKFSQLQPGTFIMGKGPNPSLEKNPHQVTLTHPFEMQTTPVTQDQYAQIMGINPSHFSNPEDCQETYEIRNRVSMCPNHPVDNVTYQDALTFIDKLNEMQRGRYTYRLPTEAEWEYAVRGGTTTMYFFGNNFHEKSGAVSSEYLKYAWFDLLSHDVAQKNPNPFGLYDMIGSVHQWVSDWYAEYPAQPVNDPTGPASGNFRALRPGGLTLACNFPLNSLPYSASRSYTFPSMRCERIGFRLVRVPRN